MIALKVTLLGGRCAEVNWEGIFEVDTSTRLGDLHLAIQRAVNFDNDHMYEFYISRTPRSRIRVHFDDENGGLYERTVESLFPLPEKRSLYYLFDYGDSWLFKITKARTKPKQIASAKYPRLLQETGERPVQYPNFDE